MSRDDFRGDLDEIAISSLHHQVSRAEASRNGNMAVPTSVIRSLLRKVTVLRSALDHDHLVHVGIVRALASERWHNEEVLRAALALMDSPTTGNADALREKIKAAREASLPQGVKHPLTLPVAVEALARWARQEPEAHPDTEFMRGHAEARRRVAGIISALTQPHARDIAMQQDAETGNFRGQKS